MKLEVATKDSGIFIIDGVEEEFFFEGAWHFIGADKKTLLVVPSENLSYYKQM